MQNGSNILAVTGLTLGAVFGRGESLVTAPAFRSVPWGIDGAGLVMAASLLALRYLGTNKDIVAAGFFVFAVGEGVIPSGAAATLSGCAPSFAAGAALWATALPLVSAPREFAVPVRGVGIASAALFAATALLVVSGAALTPVSSPLPFFAYPFLVLAFIGWIWTLLSESRATKPAGHRRPTEAPRRG
jgi:hypothetical protein